MAGSKSSSRAFRVGRDREPHIRWSPGEHRRYTVTPPLGTGLSKCPAECPATQEASYEQVHRRRTLPARPRYPARLLGGVRPRRDRRGGDRARPASPPPCSRTSPSVPSTTTRSSSAIWGRANAPTPWTPWRPRTPRPASPASPPGCTRATRRCAASSNGAATPSTSRRGPWAWRWMTSALPRPDIELGPADWPEYLRMDGLPPDFLGRADHAAFHCWSPASTARSSRRRWRSTSATTAGSTTSGRSSRPGGAGLGTALTAAQVHDARARGCQTASLQSTADGRARVRRGGLPRPRPDPRIRPPEGER